MLGVKKPLKFILVIYSDIVVTTRWCEAVINKIFMSSNNDFRVFLNQECLVGQYEVEVLPRLCSDLIWFVVGIESFKGAVCLIWECSLI